MDISSLTDNINSVSGNFSDLSVFNFSGVYILYEKDEIVYIGSSYSRVIKDRLEQYIRPNDTGNTLLKNVLKIKYNSNLKSASKDLIKQAIEYIKTLRINAISHSDLEISLIRKYNPKYNGMSKPK